MIFNTYFLCEVFALLSQLVVAALKLFAPFPFNLQITLKDDNLAFVLFNVFMCISVLPLLRLYEK